MNLDDYCEKAQALVDLYSDRNTLYANIDKMVNLDWDFPDGMPDWVLKVVSTDPLDTITTVVRTFATVRPRFKILPMLNDQPNRDRANQIETAISYNFKQAGRRMDTSVEWAIMRSATKYAEIAAQVIYLPYQEKILNAMGKDTKRIKAAKRFGDYAFIFHHPGNVYTEWSEYGVEGVLTCRVQTIQEFESTWGEKAKKLAINKEYDASDYVTSWDYTNYEKRVVWGVLSDSVTPRVEGSGEVIMDEENKLGFIPYVITRWGDDLSANSDERVEPLLKSVYNSGQFDMLNVLDSLDASLTFKRASQPQYAAETPPNQDIEIDATEPIVVAKLPAGTRNFIPLPSQQVDQRLTMQKAQFAGRIWQSTVSKTLNSLEFPSGTAYSSVNQLLTQATNSLSPYKMLGEKALSELAHQMLCWGVYYDKEYGNGSASLYGAYEDKTRMGQEIRIPFNTVDPDELQIEVTLTADIPVDKLQQINGAILVKNNFRVPEDELIEELGYGDANELAKRRNLEDYQTAYIQADLQRITMQPQLEAQQQQMQQQAQMQSQAMQQEQAARQQEQAQADARNGGTPSQEAMAGMDPAMGQMPPVNMSNGQA